MCSCKTGFEVFNGQLIVTVRLPALTFQCVNFSDTSEEELFASIKKTKVCPAKIRSLPAIIPASQEQIRYFIKLHLNLFHSKVHVCQIFPPPIVYSHPCYPLQVYFFILVYR